jgi:hypothetical protein
MLSFTLLSFLFADSLGFFGRHSVAEESQHDWEQTVLSAYKDDILSSMCFRTGRTGYELRFLVRYVP